MGWTGRLAACGTAPAPTRGLGSLRLTLLGERAMVGHHRLWWDWLLPYSLLIHLSGCTNLRCGLDQFPI
jgi:hypothetical protein